MLNMQSKTMTESPLQTVNISSYGQAEQISYKVEGARYQIFSMTDKGCDKQENEDSILVKCGETAWGPAMLLAVADGVGGLKCGAEASRIAIQGLNKWWDITLKSIMYKDFENVKYLINESLSAEVDKINTEIYQHGTKSNKRMATTLSAIFILGDWYCIKHVGDSRIYLLSRGFTQITEDHNLLNQYLKSSSLDKIKCNCKALNNVLTKCLGIKPQLELFETAGELLGAEAMLICTDGLYKLLSTIEIHRGIGESVRSVEEIRRGLNFLVNKARKRGERDDISAIVMAINRKPKDSWYRFKQLIIGRQY